MVMSAHGPKQTSSRAYSSSALRLSLPKTLQVLRQLGRERQVTGVEAFDLIDAGAAFLARLAQGVSNVELPKELAASSSNRQPEVRSWSSPGLVIFKFEICRCQRLAAIFGGARYRGSPQCDKKFEGTLPLLALPKRNFKPKRPGGPPLDDDGWYHNFQKLAGTRLKEMLQQGLSPNPPKIVERLKKLSERERSQSQPNLPQIEKSDSEE
jgi:hypothetical protein